MESIILNGDCIIEMGKYPDNYFDSVVTDPPYGLGKEPDATKLMRDWVEHGYHEIKGSGFMGKEWDAFVPQPLFWKEVFRVLKPGGHVLAFYGTRTYDWGVMAMRFAGFEVRDCIQWLYGSGFPKSHNISKAIDKLHGAERETTGKRISAFGDFVNKENGWNTWGLHSTREVVLKDIPATDNAKKWEGWGSALKPANEPIVLARKPLEKGLSIAENVLKWGTGGINIDGCRVFTNEKLNYGNGIKSNVGFKTSPQNNQRPTYNGEGRFPANIILDKIAAEILDEQSGLSKSFKRKKESKTESKPNINFGGGIKNIENEYDDSGGASRFFYVAKASKSERNKGLSEFDTKQTKGGGGTYNEEAGAKYGSIKAEGKNFHPTVKPVKLMQYLARLVTPPNGIVLDPFCGSGTTGIACKIEGFKFVGMEQDSEYAKIAEARIKNTLIENTLW